MTITEISFVVSVILIAGIGGLTLTFGDITLTEVAAALILGILTKRYALKEKKATQPRNNYDKNCRGEQCSPVTAHKKKMRIL